MPPRRFSARFSARHLVNASRKAALAAAAANADSHLYWDCAKIPMYTVAVTPVLIASSAWLYQTGSLAISPVAHFLLAAILIIAWLNICNDVFDHATGIDKNKKESLVNLLGGTVLVRYSVFALANLFLSIAFLSIRWLARNAASGHTVLSIMGIAVFAGYAYQGPPFRLGYWGVGEFICYFAWSIAMAAMYYAQSPNQLTVGQALWGLITLNSPLPAAASLVATPTTLILLCSHFHQKDDDFRAGKLSPIVRLGTRKAAQLVRLISALFLLLHLMWSYLGIIPKSCAFVGLFAAIPNTVRLRGFIRDYHDKPAVVRSAKYIVVRMHFVHGVALSAAFTYAAWARHGTITFT